MEKKKKKHREFSSVSLVLSFCDQQAWLFLCFIIAKPNSKAIFIISSSLFFFFASSLEANQEAPSLYLSWKLNHYHPHHRKEKHHHCLMHFVAAFIVIAIMHFNRCKGLMIMLWSCLNELARDFTFEHFHAYNCPTGKCSKISWFKCIYHMNIKRSSLIWCLLFHKL